jgi:hypothetical protein
VVLKQRPHGGRTSLVAAIQSHLCQVHAQAIRSRAPRLPTASHQLQVPAQGILSQAARLPRARIRGVVAFAKGGNQMDEYRMIEMYQNLGLDLEPTANLVESGTVEVLQRMREGRLKVFASLTNPC